MHDDLRVSTTGRHAGWRSILPAVFLLWWQGGAVAQQLPETAPEPPPQTDDAVPLPAGEPAAQVIEADDAAQPTDAEIKSRLERIFGNLSSLRGVSVRVSDGVIILDGTVNDLDSRELAQQLAERITGAVIVVNNITRDRSIRSRTIAAAKDIEVRLKDLAGNSPLLLLALAVVVIAWLTARLAGRATSLYQRLSRNWFVRDLLRQLVQLAIMLAGIVVALQLLDATAMLGSIVGALGILGLAVGFATRDTAENYIASILLSVRQPFQREDYINVDGTEGKVSRLTSRATVLMSADGNHIRIPNAKVYKATIVNYTRNPLRRIDFDVSVSASLDLARCRDRALRALSELPGLLESPPPACLVETLEEGKTRLRLYGWIDQRESDYLKLKSEAQRLVREALEIPEEQELEEPRAARVPGEEAAPAERAIDTAPDRAIVQQMRAEKRDGDAADLLDQAAPRE